jgi:SagB-type dehydrogenase family enzyme
MLDCRSPLPRAVEQRYTEWEYPTDQTVYLPKASPPKRDFFDVLESRQTERQCGPLSLEELAQVLWWTAKTRVAAQSHRWEHRPTPSAGGRHPIDIIVWNCPKDAPGLHLYDCSAHALRRIHIQDVKAVAGLVHAAEELVGTIEGTILWHGAQIARTSSKYRYAASLIWRDAGALVATTAIVAEALSLCCCPLGITGEPYLSSALRSRNAVQGVGGCLVGSRQE